MIDKAIFPRSLTKTNTGFESLVLNNPLLVQARCCTGSTEGIVTRNGSGRLTIVDTAGRARNIIRRTRDTRASVTSLAHISTRV